MKKRNPFKQFVKSRKSEPKEIQKAEIFNSLKYNNPIMIKKTGKEIKDHIKNVILPNLLTKKESVQLQLDDFLSNVAFKPTHPCWTKIEMNEEEFPYKEYDWNEINWTEKSFGDIFGSFGDVEEEMTEEIEDEAENDVVEKEVIVKTCPKCAQSKEESEARSQYNRLVEDFRDIVMDIKTSNVLINNLKDSDEYWLNLEQLTALKFEEE